jgi:undecaprenyl-diphosphatase
MKKIERLDWQLLKRVYLSRGGKYLPLKTLIFMGDGPFWFIVLGISALVGIIYAKTSFLQLSLLIFIGLTLAQLAFIPLKLFIKRRRPYANSDLQQYLGIVIENRDPGHGSKELESFPSGHLYWTTMGVLFICYQFGLTGLILFGWMIPVMTYIRPYLGVHYPSDVLAGMILGILTAKLTVNLLPPAFHALQSLEHFRWYPWLYLGFIFMFILIGYRSWLQRV